jgi:uncharacterized protein (DUF362 family)
MPNPTVVFKKVGSATAAGVRAAVETVLADAGLESLAGKRIFLKINAMSREVLPGRNTSPWVLDAVLAYLRARVSGLELMVGDADAAGFRQLHDAWRNWGYAEIARRYQARLVNLSDEEFVPVAIESPLCSSLELPRVVMEADAILNLPVLKTHVLTGITGCLKNHWGLLPRLRYQHHVHVAEFIAEINALIRQTVYNLVDATVAIEGSGPKTGRPRTCGVIVGGSDRVAVDAALLAFMSLPEDLAPHVALSERRGVGTRAFQVAGDGFAPVRFEPPSVGKDVVSLLERMLRGLPVLGPHFYHPRVASVLGLVGTKYNELVWFRLVGRRLVREFLENSAYRAEFEPLCARG